MLMNLDMSTWWLIIVLLLSALTILLVTGRKR
jgi:hypothetical protein